MTKRCQIFRSFESQFRLEERESEFGCELPNVFQKPVELDDTLYHPPNLK